MSTAATTCVRDEALWAEEVARVPDGAAVSAPAVGRTARDVLTSLIADTTADRVSGRDAGTTMREAISRPGLRVVV